MIRINLIPREERVSLRPKSINWILIGLVVAPVLYGLILTSIILYQDHQIVVLEEMIQEEQAALAHYKPVVDKIARLTKEKAEIESRLAALDQLDGNRRLVVSTMEAMNRCVPSFIWVEHLGETGAPGLELTLRGYTFSNLIISDFIERLEESEFFDVVDLTIAQEKRIGDTRVVEFDLVVRGTSDVAGWEEDDRVALLFLSPEEG
jgi:Tfp pilus assembly protein PilN